MGLYLDLDDVSAGHPLAQSELQALRARVAEVEAQSFAAVAHRICEHTPEDCIISVRFESGAAWVELRRDRQPADTPLPDSSDKTLLEQVNEALCVANGWNLEARGDE